MIIQLIISQAKWVFKNESHVLATKLKIWCQEKKYALKEKTL